MNIIKEDEKIKSLNQQVYSTIKDQIIKGFFTPGQKLVETKLVELLNTSRTPIREALRRLEMEGLVVFRSSQGVEVTNFTEKSMKDLFECNSVLEGLAARKAAESIDNETLDLIEETLFLAGKYFEQGQIEKVVEKNTYFHDLIINAGNNNGVIQMMSHIRSHILAYRSFISTYQFRSNFNDEHWRIFEAIKSRNPDIAEEMMRKHILDDYKAVQSQLGDYFKNRN